MSDFLANTERESQQTLTRHNLSAQQRGETTDTQPGFLCFTLDGNEFGVDLNLIRQIVMPPPLTWVPRADPHILGVVSIRGAVVTAIDLRQLLGLEPSSWPRSVRMLIVERGEEQLALLVDGVTQVRRVPRDDLESSDSLEGTDLSGNVQYVFRPTPTQAVVVIDLDTLLAEKLA